VNWDYQWSQVVGQAWADDAFKQRLFADPTTTLQECGLTIPPGIQVKVVEGNSAVEDTNDLLHLVLPPRPSAEDLSEEELLAGSTPVGATPCGWCERCECHRCHHCERCSCGRCD
jgi:hypothetical protein